MLKNANFMLQCQQDVFDFALDGVPEKLEIYTTRCDTLYGVTFMVMAPEHPMIEADLGVQGLLDQFQPLDGECQFHGVHITAI